MLYFRLLAIQLISTGVAHQAAAQIQASPVPCRVESTSDSSGLLSLLQQYTFDFGSYSCVLGTGGCDSAAGPSRDTENSFTETTLGEAFPNPQQAIGIYFQPPAVNLTEAACSRVRIENSPPWISSAIWMQETSEILVINPRERRLVALRPNGSTRELTPILLAGSTPLSPSRLARYKGKLFLTSDGGGHGLFMDRNLKALSRIVSLDRDSSTEIHQASQLTDWVLVGNKIVAYGAVRVKAKISGEEQRILSRETESDWIGIFTADLNNSPPSLYNTSLIDEVDNSKYQKYYQVAGAYFAADDKHAFFVEFGESTSLRKLLPITGRKITLKALPETYLDPPPLPEAVRGPRQAREIFSKIEAASIPTALFSKGSHLQVLTREPIPGGTAWKLHIIDHIKDELVATLRLPSHAGNVNLVPGEEYWYLVEKEYTTTERGQEPTSLLAIPSQWILRPNRSPLNIQKGGVVVCAGMSNYRISPAESQHVATISVAR